MPRFALDIDSVPRPVRSQSLLDAVNQRVVIADGAMGTMLQGRELSLEGDFQGLEGCNEILNATRPDVIADIHEHTSPRASTRSKPTPSARTGQTSPTTASTTASPSSR